ncbi:hypothetical protein [Okeania sp. SIO1I7]|uniref:hypothetical protein n=1 Tax=Okeania sp. SIO1I7 TaxID=2607772 RepID=UPI0013F8D1AA|nr:hypothetical protein [Okeania sp. SIO1I7]NET25963.1 hypothetical protein [Okeania sp. SIO1I7]
MSKLLSLLSFINPWAIGVIILCIGIFITIVPIIRAFLKKIDLDSAGTWFDNANNLGEEQERLKEHFSRIKGTLVYWKNQAAAYQRLDSARVIWSLISAISLPVLIQFYDATDKLAVSFMTLLTTWTGLIVTVAYTFKAEEKYQGFRQQESDYYDISRTLLDFPNSDPQLLKQQVDEYIQKVADIRKFARRIETGSPPSAL